MKLKIDFHVHSHKSYDCLMKYEQIIETAKKRGLDGVCICDHACVNIAESLSNDNDDFIIIPAVEFSAESNHIIGMFLEREPEVCWGQNFVLSPDVIVEQTHKNGGICILAHPFESKKSSPEVTDELMKLVDGVEVYNSHAPYKYSSANRQALKKAEELKIVCRTAGSDAHLTEEIGNAYCIVDTPSRSLEDIKNAVLAGKTQIVGHHCKRTHITRSRLIKYSKLNRPFLHKLKHYISYPIRALQDLSDVIFKREL